MSNTTQTALLLLLLTVYCQLFPVSMQDNPLFTHNLSFN